MKKENMNRRDRILKRFRDYAIMAELHKVELEGRILWNERRDK
jgi:hypothetical protein